MVRILFVCHGNICRSPMAEFVMRHMVREAGLEGGIVAESAAATLDAIGMGVHRGTQRVLASHGIYCGDHRARLMRRIDYDRFDLIVGMDDENLADIARIVGPGRMDKVHLLLDWTDEPRDVADPWFTNDYETTFADVWRGCAALLQAIAPHAR